MMKRVASLALSAGIAAAMLGMTPAAAVTGKPIGPDQWFQGYVNGEKTQATIRVACGGPIWPGKTGHPLPGQTLAVDRLNGPVVPATAGYTGQRGEVIVAQLTSSRAQQPPLAKFATYGKQELSTKVTVPCTGTRTVAFTPRPHSDTAESSTVTVRFTYIGN